MHLPAREEPCVLDGREAEGLPIEGGLWKGFWTLPFHGRRRRRMRGGSRAARAGCAGTTPLQGVKQRRQRPAR
eukprot:7156174-Alexandrium_andersonii.AAC.1